MKHLLSIILTVFGIIPCFGTDKKPDPNFRIYICIGQSNMEGCGNIEPIDTVDFPDRFKLYTAIPDTPHPANEWTPATPPIMFPVTGLEPTDWFGRTMVANTPDSISIGVIGVTPGGAGIRYFLKGFDSSQYTNESPNFTCYMAPYDHQPYKYLIDVAQRAKHDGIISGILFQQGEADILERIEPQWTGKLAKLYYDILSDLDLDANEVPLIVGETVYSALGGSRSTLNGRIHSLAKTIPTMHVVSAANLPHYGDHVHFTTEAYRILGCRYAKTALQIIGIENPYIPFVASETPESPVPDPNEGDFEFRLDEFNPQLYDMGSFDIETGMFQNGSLGFGGWDYGVPVDLSGYDYIVAELHEPQTNGAQLRLWDHPDFYGEYAAIPFAHGAGTIVYASLKSLETVPLSRTTHLIDPSNIHKIGFYSWGGTNGIRIKRVYATNANPTTLAETISADSGQFPVYNMQGIELNVSSHEMHTLPAGLYIVNGAKILIP